MAESVCCYGGERMLLWRMMLWRRAYAARMLYAARARRRANAWLRSPMLLWRRMLWRMLLCPVLA
eukprot:1252412-Rhodomonas_salina.4